MIKFIREEKKIKVSVDTNRNYEVFFWRESHAEIDAILLREHLQEELCRKIEGIRRSEYEQGYKDGKQHRKKETWFSSVFN